MRPKEEFFCKTRQRRKTCEPKAVTLFQEISNMADSFMFGRENVQGEMKAYKVRLYPNKAQKEELSKIFGCCRFLWNKMLAERIRVYSRLKHDKPSLYSHPYKTEARYKQDYLFLAKVDSIALQQARIDLKIAYNNFFNNVKKRKAGTTKRYVGFPKFKSKRKKQTYRTEMVSNNLKIDFRKKSIKLPKIKSWIKYKDERSWDLQSLPIRNITVSKTKSGKYFASILVNHTIPNPLSQISRNRIEAFDMSATHFLVGVKKQFKNPRFYRSELARLRRLHRNLSRKKKGSQNRWKAQIRLSRHYDKINNRKKNWTHKTALKLAKQYDAIILEDLNVKGMQQFNSGLSKSITLDFSWNQFKKILEYKLRWHGKYYREVGRFFPSSKLCSDCGYKNVELQLSDREWECPSCGNFHNRDRNAGANLKKEGIKLLIAKGITIT